jgi:putative membrane protein
MSEFCSIHWGFPYGDYYYIPHTVGEELWVAGVPFMDSLSYVFLSYCSYSMAIFLLSPVWFVRGNVLVLETHQLRRSWQTLALGSFLFVFLDIIIDPVAFQGHRWFLGQIYGYRHEGVYFGIPMSNFGGWLLVGLVMIASLQLLDRVSGLEPRQPSTLHAIPWIGLLGPVLYISVLLFNLFITFWIGEILLATVGALLIFFPALLAFFFMLYKQRHTHLEHIELHMTEFSKSRPILNNYRWPEDIDRTQLA